MFRNAAPHVDAGHVIPDAEMAEASALRERKGKVWPHVDERQVRRSGTQSAKRTASGICESSGCRVSFSGFAEAPEALLMRYLDVSRPRHSARRVTFVPAMGAQRRSTGGRICLWR